MKIHEFQAKAILARYGVPVPRGEVAHTPSDVAGIARRLGGTVVVKAQIHAGGRGKGGGVKLAKSPDEAEEAAKQMFGMRLVTHQTGPEGRIVKRILVEEGLQIARELYLGLVIDRAAERPVMMVSPAGGMEIEKVAAETPDLIYRQHVDPAIGLVRLPGAPARLRPRPRGRVRRKGGQGDDRDLQHVPCDGRLPRRGQPPHRHGRR